jgi:hypothetical protein
MIVIIAKHIRVARRSGLALRGSSMTHSFITISDFLINQGFFYDTPYAALRAPRSRRDKDMSDNKTNKPTIRLFRKGDSHLFGKKMLICRAGDTLLT